MKPLILTSAFAICCVAADQHAPSVSHKPAALIAGLGSHHHPVSTKNPEAQRFFDQGLILLYAFNHDEAIRSFQRAAELDPNLAMAYWGVALCKGPNYNLPGEPERQKLAYEALQKALELSKNAPEHERAYIEALAQRYDADPKADMQKLAAAYKNAMGELAKRYPDDLDAATLYAESAMNLRPWQLWTPDGKPAEGTEEIIAVLEGVLRRNPDHPGANHYYIHAVEMSPYPERALPSAERLKTIAPAAGHLVHMPAHIYIRIGDYEQAARQNVIAAAADEAYLKRSGATGVYPMMYYSHNLHFLAVAEAMQGRFAEAMKAANKLAAHVGPHVKDMPMLEGFVPTPTLILVRFRQWDEILNLPAPEGRLHIAAAIRHFARGLAYAAKGRLKDAEKEHAAFLEAKKAVPPDAKYSDVNTASSVLPIAGHILAAKLAVAKGDKKAAIEHLQAAIEAEDKLNYMEPADWYIPPRESLGGVLLLNGDHAGAEKVFRADLDKNRRNPRSLFGLRESLKAQGKTYAAGMVDQQFQQAWRNADKDTQLKIDDL